RRVGCGQFLSRIRVPTLLIAAEDDPFNPASTIPWETANASPYLYPQFTKHGGHVGFVHGATPLTPRYWMEEQMLRFFTLMERMRDARGGIKDVPHS
ncbi:MAG: hydrolase, partial [Candidatus Hydrogenedentes bacterium]|nr:hydrolase [Candidatus Hydrogenedentota bacterium]